MNEEDILEVEKTYSESKLQHICVAWFRTTFPEIGDLLFAVPNGGWRGARAGAQMVYEGQVRGVSDLILLVPNGTQSSLCIEMKVPKRKGSSAGRQSEHQKQWEQLVASHGNCYCVCHGLLEFIVAVCDYFDLDTLPYLQDACNKYPMYR